MNTVRVSVVIPAYNAARFLPRCIESVLEQTEDSIQLVVVNDGSTDQTLKIAKDYAQRDSRILVVDQPNRGVSAARNHGISKAVGEYLCFMDSDDWAAPGMVTAMVSACELAQTPVAVAGIFVDYHNESEEIIHSELRTLENWQLNPGDQLPDRLYDKNFINLLGFPWNKIYKRSWLIDLGLTFDEDLSLFEDLDFNARIFSNASKVVFVKDAYIHYVQRPRESLVTIRTANFLSDSQRAIQNVDTILSGWGVEEQARNTRASNASARTLWSALNGAAKNSKRSKFIRTLVESSDANDLISCALKSSSNDFRDKFAIFVFRHEFYWLGVMTVSLLQPVKKYKAYIFRLLKNNS